MNSKDLYQAIGKLDDDILEQSETAEKKTVWWKRTAAAACLCLAAGAFLWPKGPQMDPQIEIKEIKSLEEAAASYGGSLLAERLVDSGAKTTGIRLSYAKGADASDPAAWDNLAITGDYNGQQFTLDCDFNGQTGENSSAKTYAVARYGDVEAAIYREKSDWGGYLYRAEFALDGVAYRLSVHSDDPEDIYTYLDLVFGESVSGEDASGAVLSDVLGLGMCRIEMEELSPHQYRWLYYVRMDGRDVCVAEQFGYDGPESWSRDLDGDGVPELICNNTYGDGAQIVFVYRNNNGTIEQGSIRPSYYEEKFGWTNPWEGGVSSLTERYDPGRGVFTAANHNTPGSDAAAAFDDGLEPFEFYPFSHLE